MDHYTDTRPALRVPAGMLLTGVILFQIVTWLHADGPANNHAVVFVEYATSAHWIAVHFGQFVAVLVSVVGLVMLFDALRSTSAAPNVASRFGIATAIVALGLYAVLQAVDGIALKRAVNAWVAAPESENVIRFAGAETVRWLEEAVRSYFSLMLGLSFLLLGTTIVRTGPVPRAIGYLAAASGLTYFGQCWALATAGFSAWDSAFIMVSVVLNVVWTAWLAIHGMRATSAVHPDTN